MAWENIWHDFLNWMYTYYLTTEQIKCVGMIASRQVIGVLCQEDNMTLEKVTYTSGETAVCGASTAAAVADIALHSIYSMKSSFSTFES